MAEWIQEWKLWRWWRRIRASSVSVVWATTDFWTKYWCYGFILCLWSKSDFTNLHQTDVFLKVSVPFSLQSLTDRKMLSDVKQKTTRDIARWSRTQAPITIINLGLLVRVSKRHQSKFLNLKIWMTWLTRRRMFQHGSLEQMWRYFQKSRQRKYVHEHAHLFSLKHVYK